MDDLLITSKNFTKIQYVIDALKLKFENTDVRECAVYSYHGMSWDYTTPGGVKVIAEGLTDNLLMWSNIAGLRYTLAARYLFGTSDAVKLSVQHAQRFHSGVDTL